MLALNTNQSSNLVNNEEWPEYIRVIPIIHLNMF